MGENQYQAWDCVTYKGEQMVVERVIANTVYCNGRAHHFAIVSPVHPSKVGQRVRCMNNPPSCVRQYVGKCGSVVKATDDGWADVLFDGMDDSRWAPFNHFIVISDSPRIMECQMVRVLVEQYSHGKGVLPKGSTGIVENCDQEFASVIVGAQGWTIPLTDLEPVESTEQPAEQGEEVRTLEGLLEALGEGWYVDHEDSYGLGHTIEIARSLNKRENRSSHNFWETNRQKCIDAAWDALHPARQRHQEEVGDDLQRLLDVVEPLFSPHGPVTGSLDWNMAWQHAEAVIKELRDGTERHHEGPFRWGQEVTVEGIVCFNAPYLYGCENPKRDGWSLLVNWMGSPFEIHTESLRPVAAPREYTLADLPEIEDGEWEMRENSDGFYVSGWDTKTGEATLIGRTMPSKQEAVRDILDRIGRPFADAAKVDGKNPENP